jgi:hypothetical protein
MTRHRASDRVAARPEEHDALRSQLVTAKDALRLADAVEQPRDEADDVGLQRVVLTAGHERRDTHGTDGLGLREVTPQDLERPLGLRIVEQRVQFTATSSTPPP